MAVINYEPNFAPVLPALRPRDVILADLTLSSTASATEDSKAKIAEVELHIRDGTEHYRFGRYEAALSEFKTARALIYNLLYPGHARSACCVHGARNSRTDLAK